MKTTAKPTPGEWRTLKKNPRRVVSATTSHVVIAGFYHDASKGPGIRTKNSGFLPSTEEAEANAALAMEAGTVHHETGLSPRQLLDQRNALWDALENIKSYPIARPHPDGPSITRDHMAEIQAAIAKVMSEGRNAEPEAPRFQNVSCSQCGLSFGPGDHGFSHCENHEGMKGER